MIQFVHILNLVVAVDKQFGHSNRYTVIHHWLHGVCFHELVLCTEALKPAFHLLSGGLLLCLL